MKDQQDSWSPAPPTPDERQYGLWINSAGEFDTCKHVCPPRIRDDHLIIYCTRGEGILQIGKHEQALRIHAGDCFVLFSGIPHAYWSDPETGWHIWFSHFYGERAPLLLELAGYSQEQPVQTIGLHAPLNEMFCALTDTVRQHHPHHGLDAMGHLYQILLYLRKVSPAAGQPAGRFLQALDGNPQSVEEMAARAGMSKYHFIREFRRHIGVSPWRYLQQQRIHAAKELLLRTDLSVKQIAYQLGFDDPNYLSRIFRKETGQSIRAFVQAAIPPAGRK